MADARELPEFGKIVLVLDKEEAQALLDVTGLIGGDPHLSRRKYFNKIRDAFEQQCKDLIVFRTSFDAITDFDKDRRSIWFTTEGVPPTPISEICCDTCGTLVEPDDNGEWIHKHGLYRCLDSPIGVYAKVYGSTKVP